MSRTGKNPLLAFFLLQSLLILSEVHCLEVPQCSLCPKGTICQYNCPKCKPSCDGLNRHWLPGNTNLRAGLPAQALQELEKECLDKCGCKLIQIECMDCGKEEWCPTPEMYPWKNFPKNYTDGIRRPVDEKGVSFASNILSQLRVAALFSNAIYDLPSLNINDKIITFGNKIELPVEHSTFTDFGAVINYTITQPTKFNGDLSNPDMLVVVFRGTENLKNFVDNIKSELVDFGCEGCKVHKTWLENYLNLKESIKNIIDGFLSRMPQPYVYNGWLKREPEIFFTGHSYGAALATLALYDFKRNLKYSNFVHLFTFGSPRVGNSKFAQDFSKFRAYNVNKRFTYHNDLVTDLPPKAFGYVHIGEEIHCTDRPEDLYFYDNFFGWRDNGYVSDNFDFFDFFDYNSGRWNILDHPMSNYLQLGDQGEDARFNTFINEVLAEHKTSKKILQI